MVRRAGGRSVGGRRLGRELYSGDGVGEGRVIWLYSYFERAIVSDSVDVDRNPCSVRYANLEPGGHYQFCTGWNS